MKATRKCDGKCRPMCRECTNAKNRQYTRDNPHRSWAASYRARARRFNLPIVEEDFTRADVIRTYGNHCVYCDSGAFEELDHFEPVCKGGPHTLANVRPACASCNNAKSRVDGCPDDRRLR